MNTDEKARFDAIALLYQRAWEQFNDRRRYEFKVTLTYWTALALAVAGSIKIKSFPSIPGRQWALICYAVLAIGLHLFWVYGIWRAQGTNQQIALFYQTPLLKLADVEFDEKMKEWIRGRTRQMGKLSHPCAIFQIGVTVLLTITLLLINWNRVCNNS